MESNFRERTGDSLCSIVDLWKSVADILKITKKQAADFVEKKFEEYELVLWIGNEISGLWEPCSGVNSDGQSRDHAYLLDVWNSAEYSGWTDACFEQWKFLKLTPEGFQAIQDVARAIQDSHPNLKAESLSIPVGMSHDEGVDPTELPPELDAAMLAFRAVSNGYGDFGDTFRNRLIVYLQTTYPTFKTEQVQRIATVANADPTPGRKGRNKK